MEETALVELIDRYKTDVESVYNTWNEQRGRERGKKENGRTGSGKNGVGSL